MSKISLGHIISEVQIELGLSDSSTTALFKVWAYDAQRSIGYSDLYTKETVWKNLEGNAIKKPKDMAIPITVSLSSNKTDCVEPVFRGEFSKCGCTTNYNSSCEIAMDENDVEFYFSDNNYRYAKIKYVSHPVDENGEPLLDEANARAIKQYINYMYTRRERKKNRKSVPQSEVDSEYQIWVRLRNEAIGESNMPKPHQMKEIGEKWMNTGITPKDVIDSRYGDWYRGTSCSTSGSSSSSSSGGSVPSDYNFTDKYAIHTNVANEILGLVEITNPTGLEYLIAENTDGTKRKIKVANLPTASGGEVNTASNVGASGVGVFDAKSGVDLEFRNLASTNTLLSIALDAVNKVIEFTVNQANISITESQISDLKSYALQSALDALGLTVTNHIGDTDIHFEMGDISITESQISDLKSYALQSALDALQTEVDAVEVDLTALEAEYDAHVADTSIHFTESSIDHENIQNVGLNTHAQIDSHIASNSAHGVSGDIVGTTDSQALTNKTVNGVTLVSGGTSTEYLSKDGTYTTPSAPTPTVTTYTPSGATQTIDFSLGDSFIIDLGSATGDVTITYSGIVEGKAYTIKVIQGATARNLIFPVGTKASSSESAWTSGTRTLIITATNDAIDVIGIAYMGSEALLTFQPDFV